MDICEECQGLRSKLTGLIYHNELCSQFKLYDWEGVR